MPVETTDDGSIRCEHCDETFVDGDERALHWYWDHSPGAALTDDEWQRAVSAYVARRKTHEFPVEATVEIPRESWAYIVELHGPDSADPEDVGPEDFNDLAELQFNYEVEGRDHDED